MLARRLSDAESGDRSSGTVPIVIDAPWLAGGGLQAAETEVESFDGDESSECSTSPSWCHM